VGDTQAPANTCSAAAVAAEHQVAELALDLGSGGLVARLPDGIALTSTRALERCFAWMHADATTIGRLGALAAKRAAVAVRGKRSHAAVVLAAPDLHDHAGRTGHRVRVEVDAKVVLAEHASGS